VRQKTERTIKHFSGHISEVVATLWDVGVANCRSKFPKGGKSVKAEKADKKKKKEKSEEQGTRREKSTTKRGGNMDVTSNKDGKERRQPPRQKRGERDGIRVGGSRHDPRATRGGK